MNVLFINALFKEDFSTLDVAITTLASLINTTKKHKAKIADTTFHNSNWKDYLSRKIKNFKPDFFAFSCNNLYMEFIKKVTLFLKIKYPNIPIIGGGYYATLEPKKTLKNYNFDYIITGDGEKQLLKLLNYYSKNKKLPENLPGTWIKKNKKIINNGQGTFEKNISHKFHLDWDLWEDIDKYLYFLQMIYFVGNRGCPYKCSFCEACEIGDHTKGNYFREINPKSYAQEIAYQWKKYKNRGMKLAQLFDPVFTINQKWLEKFTKEYSKLLNPQTHPLSIFSRIDHLNEEKIKLLKKMGCKIIRVGIESGDNYIRNQIHKKNITTKKILEIDNLIQKHKITRTYYYILGAPDETTATINKTIKLALKLNASRSAFFIYKPITFKSIQIINKTKSHIDFSRLKKVNNLQYGSVIYSKQLSNKKIEFLQKKAYFLFLIKKITKMIKKQKLRYFVNLIKYLHKGMKNDLSLKYLIPYYHIYAYDNILK